MSTRLSFFMAIGLLFLVSSAALADHALIIPGTGDSQALLRTLAQAFEASHPGESIEVPDTIGSTGGIKAVARGMAPLGRVARPLKEKEKALGLNYRVFAYSPVVFAAHLVPPCLDGISSSQAVDIFSGRITSWSELGACPDTRIYVAGREAGDSSRGILDKLIAGFGDIAEPAGKTIFTTPELRSTLKRYPNTIGYAPLDMVSGGDLTILSLDGIAPTASNVQNGSYRAVIPYGLVWKGELAGTAREFVEFLFSDRGQTIVRDAGLIPAR